MLRTLDFGAGVMATQVKMLAPKPNDLSSSSRTPVEKGGKMTPIPCPMTFTCMP